MKLFKYDQMCEHEQNMINLHEQDSSDTAVSLHNTKNKYVKH